MEIVALVLVVVLALVHAAVRSPRWRAWRLTPKYPRLFIVEATVWTSGRSTTRQFGGLVVGFGSRSWFVERIPRRWKWEN